MINNLLVYFRAYKHSLQTFQH